MRLMAKACLLLVVILLLPTAGSRNLFAFPASQESIDSSESVSVVRLVKMSRDRLAAEDLTGALNYARKAVAQDPAYGEAWKQLGRVQMRQGAYGEASSSLEMALGLKPDDEQARTWLLRVQVAAAIKAGRFADAKKRLETILKTAPDDQEIRNLLAGTYAAEAASRHGSDISELLTKIVTLEPERGAAWRDLGWALFTKGEFTEAVAAWDRALEDKRIDRKALIEKTVAALAEQKQTVLVKQCWQRWSPGSPFLPLGMRFIELNRLMAAREILTIAWDSGEDPVASGLYLAYTESRAGACLKTYDHLRPYSEKVATDENKERSVTT